MARPSPNRTMPGTWAAASSALGEQGVAHPYRACGGVAAVSGPPEGKETGLFPASAYGRRLKARVVPFGRTRPVPSSVCGPCPAGANAAVEGLCARPTPSAARVAGANNGLAGDGLVEILKAYLETRWQALFTVGATRDDMVRSGGTKPLPCCREVRS